MSAIPLLLAAMLAVLTAVPGDEEPADPLLDRAYFWGALLVGGVAFLATMAGG